MNSVQPIAVSQASVATAQVTIKAVMIGKKQMTLSVFRQLPVETCYLINSDGDVVLRGALWGRVRYCSKCEGLQPHFHVIWQKDDELRSDLLYLSTYRRGPRRERNPSLSHVNEDVWVKFIESVWAIDQLFIAV